MSEEEMQRLIVQCKAAYEEEKNDAFLSNVRYAELEELQNLSLRLHETEPAVLLRCLREEQPALEAQLKEEEDHPTFNWYDEYHHAKRLAGVLAARRSVMKLLEAHKDGSE